ncbi:MAG: hypothetical protein WCQ32_01225 [bacterium]
MEKNIYWEKKRDTLEKLIRSGLELRFPGGKSLQGNFSSLGTASRINQYEDIELLIIPYNPKIQSLPFKEEKFPERPKQTFYREFLEETGIRAGEIIFLNSLEVKDSSGEDKKHRKYSFFARNIDVTNIVTKLKFGQRVGTPIWVPIILLERYIWRHHRWIFFEVKKELQKRPVKMLMPA